MELAAIQQVCHTTAASGRPCCLLAAYRQCRRLLVYIHWHAVVTRSDVTLLT
jgi:hypothetical protein